MMDPLMQERLNSIPHLDLGASFDLDRLRGEAARITDYVGYETVRGKQYRKAWLGRSLIGYETDSRKGMHEPTLLYRKKLENDGAVLVATDLAAQVPYMMDIVRQLDAQHDRVRVMVISRGSHLAWHSHVKNHGQFPS